MVQLRAKRTWGNSAVDDDIDLTSLESDVAPPDEELGRAPHLSLWRLARLESELHLVGFVTGHPRFPDGWTSTNALVAIAKDRTWCRTRNTLYVLDTEKDTPHVQSIFDDLNETMQESDVPRPKSPHSVIVLREIGGTSFSTTAKEVRQEFQHLLRESLPLVAIPNLAKIRSALVAEYPYAVTAVDILLSDLAARQTVKFKPTLFCGPPGSGKTRLVRRLFELSGIAITFFDGAGSSDSTFGGTPRRWNSGEPSVPLEAVRSSMTANPGIILDEIDKSANGRTNGSLGNAILPFIDSEISSHFSDPYVQFQCDLSHVSFFMTANDELLLPKPLRDRLRLVRIPLPSPAHLPALARNIVREFATEAGVDPDWVNPLDGDEIEIAAGLWKGGSLRRLRAVIERILARRDEMAMRH
jgi:hypothetical protein